MSDREPLSRNFVFGTLLRMYRPNVSGGPNFAPAVSDRGRNALLLQLVDEFNLDRGEFEAACRARDVADQIRSDRAIERANAEQSARARETAT